MENKLQELTQKLYDEGLSKGRKEADTLVAEAQAKAKKIVADAEADAARIKKTAQTEAEDLRKNTLTELSLAGKQVISKLKTEIAEMIVAKSTQGAVASANLDPDFIKDILVAVAQNWNNNTSEKVTLKAMLPAEREKDITGKMEAGLVKILGDGIEIGYSDTVKSGFRVGPKEGGYYISFTDDSFNALLSEYLRPKVSEMLYGKQE